MAKFPTLLIAAAALLSTASCAQAAQARLESTAGRQSGKSACGNVCYRKWAQVKQACTQKNGAPRKGCAIARCVFSPTRNTPGFQCERKGARRAARTALDAVDGAELVARFQWGPRLADLDARVSFVGETKQFAGDNAHVFHRLGRDVKGKSGTEEIVVRVGKARRRGRWTDSVSVGFFADYYIDDGIHDAFNFSLRPVPAVLRTVFRFAGNKTEITGTDLAVPIMPAFCPDERCPKTAVAKMFISRGKRFNVRLVQDRQE